MRLAPAAVLIVAGLTLAAPARADVFCAPAPCSDGMPENTIQHAIDAADANGGADVVSIRAGTWNVTAGQSALQVNQPDTEVHGAGIGQTILTVDPLPPDAGYGLTVISGARSRLADLTLRLPSDVTPGHNSSIEGADVNNGTVERVRVDAPGAHFGPGGNDGQGSGLLIRGGAVRDSAVTLGTDTDSLGIRVIGTATLSDLSIEAKAGLHTDPEAQPNPRTVNASRLRINAQNPISVSDGFLRLADSQLDAREATADMPFGIVAFNGRAPDPAGLTLDRVTEVGNGASKQTALYISGNGGSETKLTARHLLAAGFGRTLDRDRFGGDLTVNVSFSNIDSSPGRIVNTGTGGGTLTTNFGPGDRAGDPLFVAPSSGDFRLGLGSPAIDIGGPDLIPGTSTDLGGAPRPRDGDRDGTAQNDAGAFEYQPDLVDPEVLDLVVSPPVFAVGSKPTLAIARKHHKRGTRIRYTLSEAATVRLRVQRRLPGRRRKGKCVKPRPKLRHRKRCKRYRTIHTLVRLQGSGPQSVRYSGRVGKKKLRPGRYRLTVLATDPSGNVSKPARARFRIVKRR